MRTLETDLEELYALYTESKIDFPTYVTTMELVHDQWARMHAARSMDEAQAAWLAGFVRRCRKKAQTVLRFRRHKRK